MSNVDVINSSLEINLTINDGINETTQLFTPNMVYANYSNYTSNELLNSLALKLFLFSDSIDMSRGDKLKKDQQQSYSYYSRQTCNAYTYENSNILKQTLSKDKSPSMQDTKTYFDGRNKKPPPQTSEYNYQSVKKEFDQMINNNIDFMLCLFLKKYEYLVWNNKIYIITEDAKKNKNENDTYFEVNNSNNSNNSSNYKIDVSVKVVELTTPAYLKLELSYIDNERKSGRVLFVPSMSESGIDIPEKMKDVSIYFSPFVKLDETVLNTLIEKVSNTEEDTEQELLEKRKVFADEKLMKELIEGSLEKQIKLYNWNDSQQFVLKPNLALIKKVFLTPMPTQPASAPTSAQKSQYANTLEINDIEYLIISSLLLDNQPSEISLNTENRLVVTRVEFKLTLKNKNAIDLITTLNIKLKIYDDASKKYKKVIDFTPNMVDETINEKSIYFISQMEIPSIAELQKLNRNYKKLFTEASEFLKLLKYVKTKNQFKPVLNPIISEDQLKINAISQKNADLLKDIFLPMNGEFFSTKINYTQQSADKSGSTEKQKYFINESTMEGQLISTPPKYFITVKLTLGKKLTMLDQYGLSCKKNALTIDKKLGTTLFTSIMEDPDEEANKANELNNFRLRLATGGKKHKSKTNLHTRIKKYIKRHVKNTRKKHKTHIKNTRKEYKGKIKSKHIK